MSDFKFSLNEQEYQAVMRKLGELADAEKKPVIKKAMSQSGRILITAGKSSFLAKNKKKTGNLYKSFTSKFKRKNTGILIGFRRGKGLGNHAHLINYPTKERWTKKGYYRGRINESGQGKNGYIKTGATYFWSDVVQAKGQEAMERIMDAVYDAVEQIKNR